MIKAVAFDWGGVIETKDRDLFEEIAKYLHLDIKEWRRIYDSLNHLANTGEISGSEVLELTAKKFNASDTQINYITNLRIEINKSKKINLELIEIIKNLKKKNYKIGLLSNNSIQLNKKLEDNNIKDLFDVVITSQEFGYQKPQLQIFKIIAKKLGVSINELLFVDNTERSLEGAESIGYTPVLYTNNEKLKEDISRICKISL